MFEIYLATIEPYHRSARSATYGMDIESFLLPSKPATVVQGGGYLLGLAVNAQNSPIFLPFSPVIFRLKSVGHTHIRGTGKKELSGGVYALSFG